MREIMIHEIKGHQIEGWIDHEKMAAFDQKLQDDCYDTAIDLATLKGEIIRLDKKSHMVCLCTADVYFVTDVGKVGAIGINPKSGIIRFMYDFVRDRKNHDVGFRQFAEARMSTREARALKKSILSDDDALLSLVEIYNIAGTEFAMVLRTQFAD